jgi:hypothetical protein
LARLSEFRSRGVPGGVRPSQSRDDAGAPPFFSRVWRKEGGDFDCTIRLRFQPNVCDLRSKAPLLLVVVAVLIAIIALFLPPIPQSLAYHNFADHRAWLGIPNFGDAVSNLPFALVGLCGLMFLFKPRAGTFSDHRERRFYLVMFAGLILTAFGSAYYHLAPENARLVWDRIPIMIVFMALLAAVIAERVSVVAGLWLFPALQAAGIGSVLVWRAGELQGHGDLRFYAAVQVCAILILLLMLLVPAKYTRASDLAIVVGFYSPCQDSRGERPSGLRPRPHRQRTHAETSGGRRRRLLDPAHAAEERSCYSLIPESGAKRFGCAAAWMNRSMHEPGRARLQPCRWMRKRLRALAPGEADRRLQRLQNHKYVHHHGRAAFHDRARLAPIPAS